MKKLKRPGAALVLAFGFATAGFASETRGPPCNAARDDSQRNRAASRAGNKEEQKTPGEYGRRGTPKQLALDRKSAPAFREFVATALSRKGTRV